MKLDFLSDLTLDTRIAALRGHDVLHVVALDLELLPGQSADRESERTSANVPKEAIIAGVFAQIGNVLAE